MRNKKKSIVFMVLLILNISTYVNAEVEVKKEYYANRTLKLEVPYKDGKKEGFEKHYYTNGALWRIVPYKKDKENGIAKQYFIDGKLNLEIPYEDGKINGVMKLYWENGQLMSEIPYKNGKKDGIARHYHKNGLFQKEVTYKKGILQINWIDTPKPTKFEFKIYKNLLGNSSLSVEIAVNNTAQQFSITPAEVARIFERFETFQELLFDTGNMISIEDISWEEFNNIMENIISTSSRDTKGKDN